MSEVSIAKPLSGSECLEACLAEFRKVLVRDERFSSHMSYTGFRAELNIKFHPQMSFIPDADRTVEVTEGEQTALPETPSVDETVTLPLRPPNQVREEADMPQPVLVKDGKDAGTEKWVKTANKPPAQKSPKHNKVVGGGQ